MTLFSPLPAVTSRRSLGELVYDSVREAIVSLRLEPGTFIYENELAESLGVSRTPIREAIRMLSGEELLEVLPQRGTRVAPISERKVSESRFVREQLETGGFRLAARLWRPERHEDVRRTCLRLLEEQREEAARGDIARFLQADEAFHQAILQVADNATLLQVIYRMRGHLNRARMLALRELRRIEPIVDEHEALLEAVAGGDEEQAASLMRAHVGKLDRELPELRQMYPDYFAER